MVDPGEALAASAGALARFRRHIPAAVLEELRQEAALRALGARVVRAGPFARTVARRLAIDWLRRESRAASRSAGEVYPWLTGAAGDRDPDLRLDGRAVARALRAAPAAYRDLVVRHFVEEEPLDDLARAAVAARGEAGPEAFGRARDLLYKRRRRALAWLRARVVAR